MRITKFLSEAPLFALYHAHDVILGDFQKRLSAEGVHFIQALILTGIYFEDRPVRPSELAKTLRAEKSNISHALRSLERAGLLERTLSDLDARAYFFNLTREGRKLVPRLIKLFDGVQNALEGSMNTRGLNRTLAKLTSSYHAMSTK